MVAPNRTLSRTSSYLAHTASPMQWWARLLSLAPMGLWRSTLEDEWQALLAVFAVSLICVLWLLRPRRHPRRVVDRRSGRSGTEARRSRQGVLSAPEDGAQALPAAGGQTREQARRRRTETSERRKTTGKNATKTYDSRGIELECAWSAPPDAGASAPAEKGKKGDKQEGKDDPRRRHASRKAGRHEHEFCCAAAREGDHDRPAAPGASAKNERRMATLERAKKTHENLVNLIVELEDTARLCTCAYCKAVKRALAESSKKRALAEHVADNDGARDSSPVASSSESGPHPRSALRTSSSAAGSTAIGAARRQGKTTLPSARGGASLLSLPARSGASTTPIEKHQVRISSGAQFYSHVVQARLKQYDPPKGPTVPQPADASGPQTPPRIKWHRPCSYWDALKIQLNQHNDVGLSQRQVPLQAAESLAAATEKSRPQAPTVFERFGGHRASAAEVEIPAARPWHSSGDLRLQAPQSMAARGRLPGPAYSDSSPSVLATIPASEPASPASPPRFHNKHAFQI